jgi:hypothetical protein
MNNFSKWTISVILAVVPMIFLSFSVRAQTQKETGDASIFECGKAQIAANKCLKEGQTQTGGLFAGLASKVSASDMGKVAAEKASAQTANLVCKDKLEKAEIACKP